MDGLVLGKTRLRECPRCEGIWADAASLEQICADREDQAAVLGAAALVPPDPSVEVEAKIRYLPCPVCAKLMNRVNFARCSHVVVDVCRQHGTWFDKDELRRIVEFIRSGGLEQARAQEIAELEEKRRELKAAQSASAEASVDWSGGWGQAERHTGVSAVAALVKSLLE
jgi:Zn-finger nucleic acid-binding protein